MNVTLNIQVFENHILIQLLKKDYKFNSTIILQILLYKLRKKREDPRIGVTKETNYNV